MDRRTISIALLSVLIGAALLGGGVWIGQAMFRSATGSNWQYGGMMGGGMMGTGWIGPNGMMGSFGSPGARPLTAEEATQAVERYLDAVGLGSFTVAEVMIFDNHAYAEVADEAGNGAFEVLVDPVTRSVTLEHGPAMMWNIEYGMMGGRGGMMGGARSMMGGAIVGGSGESISADQAVETAQNYLDRYQPALTTDEHADAFPGYYTVHTLRDGEVVGMLSVNAFTGDVWYHTWHGTLIEVVSHDD